MKKQKSLSSINNLIQEKHIIMKLRKVTIFKFKSFLEEQNFDIENDVTILVGMNESGKTSALQAIAKTNYFQDDVAFKFNLVQDYPRKEKKKVDKSGENPKAIQCVYEISDSIAKQIEDEMGDNVVENKVISRTTYYDGSHSVTYLMLNIEAFFMNLLKKDKIYSETLFQKINKARISSDIDALIEEYKDENYKTIFESYKIFFDSTSSWENQIEAYIYNKYISPNFPKFLYYDEYYALPSRISLEKIKNKTNVTEEHDKTANALIELADINLDELIKSQDFEAFKAELEATQEIISDELFKYWKTNKNLNIVFDIDKKEQDDQYGKRIIEHILDIRVRNKGVTLPLKNRSKGFNWFFSFLVWFKKIQEDTGSKYVLLLDEPGLNLHASAQSDLLRFIEDLSLDYQIIYSTHSPFMIPSEKLNRVRTVLETENTSVISDSIQEKDPNTLFPLQAALGYDIAQNLFVSKKNLLVEGVSDLVFLQFISNLLVSNGKEGLSDDIVIVPVGGLDKVATFISLLRGQELDIVCLLDSFTDAKGKSKLADLIREKIIKEKNIIFFDEFVEGYKQADLEDIFSKEDYLKIYNEAFSSNVTVKDLEEEIQPIIIQLNKYLSVSRFNHYRPANKLLYLQSKIEDFDEITINRFEEIFKKVNQSFK